MQRLAIFDLDNTLLEGDSDYAWCTFMAQHLLDDPESFNQQSKKFYEDYENHTLDIHEYFDFVMSPLKSLSAEALNNLLNQFIETVLPPMIRPQAQACVQEHKAAGDTTLIITATSSLVTSPIRSFFSIDHLMGTDPEFLDGQLTGKILGTPCFQEGKIDRLIQWMETHTLDVEEQLEKAFFYSDSINDAPLLRRVGNPRVVNPDTRLSELAKESQWPIVDFS